MRIYPGTPYPLGATYDGAGTNFSLFSEVGGAGRALPVRRARQRDADRAARGHRLLLARLPAQRRCPASATATASTARGTRSTGTAAIPAKLLLDPYAKAIEGEVQWNEAVFPYHFDDPEGSRNDLDSAPFMPKCVVINPFFDWGNDRPPRIPMHETVIYEVHVKGFTKRHPEHPRGAARHLRRPRPSGGDRPPQAARRHRGRAAAGPPVRPRQPLLERGLRNYWGYNSIGYLAPHNEYAAARRRHRASRCRSSSRW